MKFLQAFLLFSIFILPTTYAMSKTSAKKISAQKNSQKSVGKMEEAQQPKWSLRTAPLAVLAKWYTLELAIPVSSNFSIGPSAIYYGAQGPYGNMFLPTYNGVAVGGHVYYFLSGVNQKSFYLGGRIFGERYRAYLHPLTDYEVRQGLKGQGVVGYQVKQNRLSWLVGGGYEYRNYQVTRVNDLSDPIDSNRPSEEYSRKNDALPFFEFKVGWDI